MGSDTRPVCYRCAQIKQACDGRLPCARCVRLSLPCRPRDSAGSSGSEGPNGRGVNGAGGELPGADIPKARIRRVQTGCLMCKRRKKKCDETKPRCGDCRRLCLECSWPAERPKEKATAATASSSPSARAKARAAPAPGVPPSTAAPTSSPFASSSSREVDFFALHGNPLSPSLSPTMSSPSPPSPLPLLSSPTSPIPKVSVDMPMMTELALRGSSSPTASTSSNGLRDFNVVDYFLNDRRNTPTSFRDIDSLDPIEAIEFLTKNSSVPDLEFLTATSAAEAPDGDSEIHPLSSLSPSPSLGFNSPVIFDAYHTPISCDSPRSVDSSILAPLSIYVPPALPQLANSQDRALFNHYTAIVSTILSRRVSMTNPYNNYLLPLAMSNDTILHCILALSASHWRKLQPQLADRGIYHQSKATQSLARLLPHVNRTSVDIALVSCLLLCMTELFDGMSEGWKLHLKGAKKLLATLIDQQGEFAATGHSKFLVRLAKFLDSAATVSTCRPPLIGEDRREAATLDRLTALPDEDDSAVYGIPKELFHLVDVINTLAEKRKDRVDEASEAMFRKEAAMVEERINTWSLEHAKTLLVSSPPPASSDDAFSGISTTNDSNVVNPLTSDDVPFATVAYEHAIRLRLHQIVEGYAIDDCATTHVEGILEAVQQIRYGSPLEACLLFPLVMAGGACWSMEQRAIIFDRLMVMERTCGFGYIYNARDLVQRVWKMRDQTEGTGIEVNWARIRYEEMHGLVVF